MQLIEIKHESCPICKSRIIMIRQKNQHCNGHWNETAEYECGCKIVFIPNFMQEEFTKPCPLSREEISKKEKQCIAIKRLQKYIQRLNVDDEFKTKIMNNFKYIT